MPVIDGEFTEVKGIAIADSRGRVALGPALAKQEYSVRANAKGEILLIPIVTVTVPASEAWLFRNPEALESVRQGLADSAAGRVSSLGSFAQYADLDVDD